MRWYFLWKILCRSIKRIKSLQSFKSKEEKAWLQHEFSTGNACILNHASLSLLILKSETSPNQAHVACHIFYISTVTVFSVHFETLLLMYTFWDLVSSTKSVCGLFSRQLILSFCNDISCETIKFGLGQNLLQERLHYLNITRKKLGGNLYSFILYCFNSFSTDE